MHFTTDMQLLKVGEKRFYMLIVKWEAVPGF